MPQKLKSEDNINQKQRNKNNKNHNKNHNNDPNGKYSQKHIRINNSIREKK
jgi:hypothetical protein